MPMATMQNVALSQGGKLLGMASQGCVVISTANSTNLQRRLAPAPPMKKKAYSVPPYHAVPHQPASVARRNARERNRVKQVNNGFAALRQHIPSSVSAALAGGRAAARKLSKVDTLRLAVEYIRSLQQLLDDGDELAQTSTHLQHPKRDLHTPPCSETSESPAPSFSSESSPPLCSSESFEACEPNEAYDGPCETYDTNYDAYEPMSPEDEELLDAISWWQQH